MMMNGDDALELLSALREDVRVRIRLAVYFMSQVEDHDADAQFHYVDFVYLGEGDEWKASYRRDSSSPSTP